MWIPKVAETADEVELREYRPATIAQIGIFAGLAGIVLGIVAQMFIAIGPYGEYEYRLWRWEADTFVGVIFGLAGVERSDSGLSDAEVFGRYYGYTSQIREELNSAEPDADMIAALLSERSVYETNVETLMSTYIDEAVEAAGLQETLPFFRDVAITWPPVEFRITSPPQLLVRSPRDRIERSGDTLLKTDLTAEQIEEIETRASREDQVGLVIQIGGLAAYPAFVRDDRNYYSNVETASHEWVHHYLAFYPLGQEWGRSGDANTLNETTASIAGRELARLVHEARPMTFEGGADGSAPARVQQSVDFNAEMRQLRLDVDDLLAAGKVEEAEALMEAKRLELAEHGVFIRKINQAYFAFYGTYADSPQSSDPIGPKVERVWELTGDVGVFLRVMRDVRNVGELDGALATLERLLGAHQAEGTSATVR